MHIFKMYLFDMGRKHVANKKVPSDYPQIAFRASKEVKEKISEQVDKIQLAMNKRRKEGEPFLNKNDIFVMALNEGLKKLK